MRENKGILMGIGVAVVVAVLVAVNLAAREDPEPQTTSPRVTSHANRAERPVDGGSPSREEPTSAEPTEPEPIGSIAEPAEGPADPPGEPGALPAEEAPGCAHPFVPTAVGEWRRYVWRQSDEERSAELRMEAVRSRVLPSGEHEIRWRVSVTASDDASQLAEEHMTSRCAPGADAEEPWFGILERSLGLTLTNDPGRWRWPVNLTAGQRFDGTASFDPTGADMRMPSDVRGPQVLRVTRNHVVGSQESVRVPAGRFQAHRVDYEEQHAFGTRGERGTGTLWVAVDVGLVKSRAENSEGIVQTIELIAMGRRRPR